MLNGKMRQLCDIAIFQAVLVNAAILDPKKLDGSCNPWNAPKLPPEQREAKKKYEAERTYKMMRKGLAMFVKNKPKKLTPRNTE